MAEVFQLRATPSAAKAIEDLRGSARKAYEKLKPELQAQGCKAAGYRLLAADSPPGEPIYSEFCCKPLLGKWRVITAFEEDVVWIVAVGEHDGDAFYRDLGESLGISGVGQRREAKPACCGSDGWPALGANRGTKRLRAA